MDKKMENVKVDDHKYVELKDKKEDVLPADVEENENNKRVQDRMKKEKAAK